MNTADLMYQMCVRDRMDIRDARDLAIACGRDRDEVQEVLDNMFESELDFNIVFRKLPPEGQKYTHRVEYITFNE